jgi:hypothetical protein
VQVELPRNNSAFGHVQVMSLELKSSKVEAVVDPKMEEKSVS